MTRLMTSSFSGSSLVSPSSSVMMAKLRFSMSMGLMFSIMAMFLLDAGVNEAFGEGGIGIEMEMGVARVEGG